jgi:hypothetical protein
VKTIRIAMSAVMDGWKGCSLALKSFGLQKCFLKYCFGKVMLVGLMETVPGRYGGKQVWLCWPYEMAGKKIGSPLPISLQIKVFIKVFQQKYEDAILSRGTTSRSLSP